ncbi:hypothetical protein BGZ99_004462 [Dissophora globulifera]|uniref:PWWP domain-containing protein n=1 Tax=Dissophora globulifera TaxID=979702 RepID=A0A9P6UZX5_9FUNG|nr:hypothetical protein BGZ99_004462 [Dissophora globulifera]
MTRAASNRKNGAGSATASSRPGPVFKGRDVVFVDPLDDKESYWWPAMIVPVPEIDSSMDCTVLNPGECLVKYFEDNKYSVVPFTDLQPFVPTTIPFLEFELSAGQKFLKNGGVVNALAYLESGKVKRKFSWHRWGSAQDEDLSLDVNKHKPINLPLVSDEEFQGQQQQQLQSGISSNTTPSPTTSTKSSTDNESEPTLSTSSALASATGAVNEKGSSSNPRQASSLKNGLQRPLAGITSQPSTLLPSPVSLTDLTTEPLDETDFNARSTRTKDSPTAAARSRSRRGSRDVDIKPLTAVDKDSSKRPLSEPTASSSLSSTATSQNGTVSSASANRAAAAFSDSNEPSKKRKALTERSADSQNAAQDSGSPSSRSSRQGSPEPGSSPRSTRHSRRNSKVTEGGQQSSGEDHTDSAETAAPTRLQTQRMMRQRSAPKSANSLSSLSPVQTGKMSGIKDENMNGATPKNNSGTDHVVVASSSSTEQKTQDDSTMTGEEGSTPMDVDMQEPGVKSNQEREQSSSMPPSSLVSTTASSTSSPSSIGMDEGSGSSPTSSSNSGLIQVLEQERREMDHSFEHVLPTLAIGSKEREAFYETCMEHLQKLRHEHRRLKEILKNSEYSPKGRRATRFSPQHHSRHGNNGHHHHYHHHHHHHHHQNHSEEKPNRRSSPALSRNNSSSVSSVGQSNKDTNGNNNSTSRSNSAALKADSSIGLTSDSTAAAAAGSASSIYQGSTPSSAILTSNISTTTRRSAATAAAAAVTATVSRSGRQSYNSSVAATQSSTEKGLESGYSKKRGNAAAQAAAAAVAAAAAAAMAAQAANDGAGSAVNTRPKRRQR